MPRNPFHAGIDIPLSELVAADQHLLALADHALADAARRAGGHLVCHPGCTQCCHGPFAISPLDALRLRLAMRRLALTDPQQANSIAARAEAYRERYRAEFPGDPETGILGVSPEEETAFTEFANEDACPALNPATGHCDLYEARPMTCRTFGPPMRHASEAGEGFAVCELCFTEATPEEIEDAEMTPPFSQEQALLAHFGPRDVPATPGPPVAGETVVAWCLALPGDAPTAV